jgi:hypothetical protein
MSVRRSLAVLAALLLPLGAVGGGAAEPSQTQPTGKFRDVQDSQGNRYKVDEKGRIFTPGQPNARRQPASAENIEYYAQYAIDMMNRGYVGPALEVFREILSLPAKDTRVTEVQAQIRHQYEEMRAFNIENQSLDINSLVFVVRHVEDGRVVYTNERYRYRLRFPLNWKVHEEVRHSSPSTTIRQAGEEWCVFVVDGDRNLGCRATLDDAEAARAEAEQQPIPGSHSSLFLAPLPLPAPEGKSVTVAIGLRAERLADGVTLERFHQEWVQRLGQGGDRDARLAALKRERRSSRSDRLRDHFQATMESQRREGEEEFIVRGGYGYYITFTSTPETFQPAREIFDRFVADFEVLP